MIREILYTLNRRKKRELLLLLVMVVFSALLELVGVSVIYPFLMIVLEPTIINENQMLNMLYTFFGSKDYMHFLLIVSGIMIIIYIGKNAFQYIVMIYQNYFIASYNVEVTDKLMRGYLNREYKFHLNSNSASLNRTLNVDVTNSIDLIINYINLFSNITLFIVLILFLAYTDLAITVVAMAGVLGFSVLFYLVFNKGLKRMGIKLLKASGKRTQWTLQAFDGVKEIKMFNCEKYFSDYVHKYTKEYFKYFRKQKNISALPQYILEAGCITLILGLTIFKINNNSDITVFVANLAAFTIAAFRLFPKISALNTNISIISYEKPSMENIYNEMVHISNEKRMQYDEDRMNFNHEININNISFSYDESKIKILDNAKFSIEKGESVAFIGESGAGKTTMIDVVLGILQPQTGQILVDGIDIQSNMPGWQKTIGYIPQNIYLFDDTIINNIIFGKKITEESESRIWEILEKVKLREFVEELPDGIYTEIGERGTRISGGQRQRIGIARALYHNPDILVLDEATSALDNETEKAIMDSVDSLQGEMTMIIIAHRLSTIRNCDKIYEVKGGKVIERIKTEVL